MTNRLRIESGSAEPVLSICEAPTDPTGQAVEFQMTDCDATTPTGSWTAGSWHADYPWNPTVREAGAQSPTIGAAGDLVATEGNIYNLWVRYSGTVVKKAAIITMG
jgi:hypothetical protein